MAAVLIPAALNSAVPNPAPGSVAFETGADAVPPELRDFQRRMYGGGRQADPERATWLTTWNPYRTPGDPSVWFARAGNSVVGLQASIPVELEVGADRYAASWAIDLVVDPARRGESIATTLVAAHQQASPIEIAFGLSDGGFSTMMRTGARHVGTASAYVFPCDHRVLAAKLRPRAARVAATAAAPTAISALRARARRAARGTRLVPFESFDAAVDDLWRQVSPYYPVIVPRDLRFTRWRFDQAPQRSEYERYSVIRRGKLIGYVVLRDSTWNGLPTLEIVDYLARPRDVARSFAAVALLARRRRKAAVECITLNDRARRQILGLGFVDRPNVSRGLRATVRTHDDVPVRSALSEPGAIFLTCADSDVDE
jgi:hypothetical protein